MGNKFLMVIFSISLVCLIDGLIQTDNDSYLLNEFNIKYEALNDSKFPQTFTIKLNGFRFLNEFNLIKFIKISNNDFYYPITSSNVYIIQNTTSSNNNVQKLNSNLLNDYNYEIYKQEDGKGYATLIESDKNSPEKYRMIGTIFSNNDNIFDLTPLSINNIDLSRVKRGINSSLKNLYLIKKRPVPISNKNLDYNNILQNIKPIYQTDTLTLNRSKRFKRFSNIKPIHLYVELLVVVDKTIYLDHQKILKTNDSDLILNNIRVYYSHFFNGVNQQYQNSFNNDPDLRISIKLKNLLFMNDSEWTDTSKYGVPIISANRGREVLQAGLALEAFKKYMNSNSFPFTYDMAISVLNKDLWLNNEPETSSVVGFSYISSVCSQYRYVIMEEIGGFAYITVASHEIGHNLGAFHDGTSHPKGYTECPTSNGNIMSSFLQIFDYRFSTCSIRAFKSHLLNSKLNSPSSRAQCLVNKPAKNETNETELLNASEQCQLFFGNDPLYCNYPGQIWSADDQCKMANGNGSYYCSTESSLICSSLWCGNQYDSFCSPSGGAAVDGTVCDKGKICIRNKCVKSELGSTNECTFNDGLIFQTYFSEKFKLPYSPMTCDSYLDFAYKNLIHDDNTGCLNPTVKEQCCNSCQKYKDFTCEDKNIYCAIYSKYCFLNDIKLNDIPIKDACSKTCRSCPKITCKDNVYLCQNGGTCQNTSQNNSVIGYKCKCPVGYYGFLCELKNPCLPNPCKNNGECKSIGSLGKYYCKCPKECNSDFTCSTCDYKANREQSRSIHEFIILLIFQIFYFLLILCILLFLQRFLNWYCFVRKVSV